MKPGEIITRKEPIIINQGRESVTLKVKNMGDRPVQIGSHYHFFEVNRQLEFDREMAYGTHLDIASGTAVRFEPGEEKEVQLVQIGGTKEIYGFNGLTEGNIDEKKEAAMINLEQKGFK